MNSEKPTTIKHVHATDELNIQQDLLKAFDEALAKVFRLADPILKPPVPCAERASESESDDVCQVVAMIRKNNRDIIYLTDKVRNIISRLQAGPVE